MFLAHQKGVCNRSFAPIRNRPQQKNLCLSGLVLPYFPSLRSHEHEAQNTANTRSKCTESFRVTERTTPHPVGSPDASLLWVLKPVLGVYRQLLSGSYWCYRVRRREREAFCLPPEHRSLGMSVQVTKSLSCTPRFASCKDAFLFQLNCSAPGSQLLCTG